jgi:hypothetical protein
MTSGCCHACRSVDSASACCVPKLRSAFHSSTCSLHPVPVELSFHGLVIGQAGAGSGPGGPSVVVEAGSVPHRLVVRAPLRNERLRPEAKLTALAVTLRPTEAVMEPLATSRGEGAAEQPGSQPECSRWGAPAACS